MLGQPEIYRRLADGFVAVRFDFFQAQHYEGLLGLHLGSGDQVILTPGGVPLAAETLEPGGAGDRLFGRHGRELTPGLLDQVVSLHGALRDVPALRLEWFLWPRGGVPWRNAVPPERIAQLGRTPLVEVAGPLPAAFEDARFLRWHVRQFIWVRGDPQGEPRVTIRGYRRDAQRGKPPMITSFDPRGLDWHQIGSRLDDAWREAMASRPDVYRGYFDNPFNRFMQAEREELVGTDAREVQAGAGGELQPPGRSWAMPAPYPRLP